MKYLIVCEKSNTGWDTLPICLAKARRAKELIREAVEFHLEGTREHGDPIPAPIAMTEYVTI